MSIEELEIYKKEILSLKRSNGSRVVLPGKNNILLTTSIFDNNDISSLIKEYEIIRDNGIEISYLDALVKKLNDSCLVHGIINYFPLEEKITSNLFNINIASYYKNNFIKDYLNDENIDLFIHLKFGGYEYEQDVMIREGMSSFSFMGCSGVSFILKDMYSNKGMHVNIGFGGNITKGEFLDEYHFTDDTITYCSTFDLEPLRYKKLKRTEMWPRTLELTFRNQIDKNKAIENYKILLDFLTVALEKLSQEDIYDVFAPMKVKK